NSDFTLALSTGTSAGTFSAVTESATTPGTYTTDFSATTAGTARAVTITVANFGDVPITPTIQVTGGGGGGGTGNGADVPGISKFPIAVDFGANADINSINLTSVDDLTVTVNLIHPNLSEISLVLVPPNKLPTVTLLSNQVDASGQIVLGPSGTAGLPSGTS